MRRPGAHNSRIVRSLLERANLAGVVRAPPPDATALLFLGALVSYLYDAVSAAVAVC